MKQQFKPKTIATTIAIALTALVILVSTQAMAQTQRQALPPPPKLPLTMPTMPGDQYAKAIINELNQRVDELNHRLGNNTAIQHAPGNNTAIQHTATILKQMTIEGKIDCPTPFTNLGHCYLAPRGHVITGPTR